MRGPVMIAGAAALVAALLLGGWLLLGSEERNPTGAAPAAGPAPVTRLTWPGDPSLVPTGPSRPNPYPTVPSTQVDMVGEQGPQVRTADDGRQVLVKLLDSDCSGEEAWLLGEYDDRVEVELRLVAKPVPPDARMGQSGHYGCVSFSADDGPYAVIALRAPLGARTLTIQRP